MKEKIKALKALVRAQKEYIRLLENNHVIRDGYFFDSTKKYKEKIKKLRLKAEL